MLKCNLMLAGFSFFLSNGGSWSSKQAELRQQNPKSRDRWYRILVYNDSELNVSIFYLLVSWTPTNRQWEVVFFWYLCECRCISSAAVSQLIPVQLLSFPLRWNKEVICEDFFIGSRRNGQMATLQLNNHRFGKTLKKNKMQRGDVSSVDDQSFVCVSEKEKIENMWNCVREKCFAGYEQREWWNLISRPHLERGWLLFHYSWHLDSNNTKCSGPDSSLHQHFPVEMCCKF